MTRKIISLLVLGAALTGQAAVAMPINNSYVQASAGEIRGFLGGYSRPTVYLDQYACGEPQLSAMACGPYTISVGTGFLQQQENSYGNYVAKFILAHEWGHTIQFTRGINRQPPMQELQADCVGGTFAKYAETNLRYPSFIENAVASARDAADYGEHGTPSQRDYYSRYGYANGFSSCMNRI
ncbi:hypothetical protein CXB49_09055 [Chromobacterium sp. ATCC 53434]|uniref:hypothetical protein n=1 Tax=Chromobacterium TaxID=535 RepID=UPI000C761B9E|nr:hypothetical protein [Chromobacterium sp. ATCC 53434]AUH50950.1 hypothetical protein CXB49_09055 [Chromobacterium sp. ATCC 53434]